MTNDIFKVDQQNILNTYRRKDVCFLRGEGTLLFDSEDNQYLDMLSGLGVVNIGHAHPEIAEAVCIQAKKLLHVSNLFYTEHGPLLAEKLCQISFGSKVFFANSGAESVEGALKVARAFGKRKKDGAYKIIAALRGFHGRTFAALAATGQEGKQLPFEPLVPGFIHVPLNDIDAMSAAATDDVAAILLEVVQGEGGVHACDLNYLKEVKRISEEKNILLIFDEVQTGIGRLGEWFGHQVFGVEPDVMTLAKGLANGLPIGAIVLNEKAASVIHAGEHASTFGGGPLVTAAALKVLEIIERDQLLDRCKQLATHLDAELEQLANAKTGVVETRGIGLMRAIELRDRVAGELVEKMLKKGYVVNNTSDHVIRLLPPLVSTEEELSLTIKILSSLIN